MPDKASLASIKAAVGWHRKSCKRHDQKLDCDSLKSSYSAVLELKLASKSSQLRREARKLDNDRSGIVNVDYPDRSRCVSINLDNSIRIQTSPHVSTQVETDPDSTGPLVLQVCLMFADITSFGPIDTFNKEAPPEVTEDLFETNGYV